MWKNVYNPFFNSFFLLDDFRMLCAIGILEYTFKKHGKRKLDQNTTDAEEKQSGKQVKSKNKEKIISTKALLLAIKACYGYLKSKEHLDIDTDIQGEVRSFVEVFYKFFRLFRNTKVPPLGVSKRLRY